jgi:diguanylate cyclase (GGDEF)-like protein/PAS domain S-box-containing protein
LETVEPDSTVAHEAPQDKTVEIALRQSEAEYRLLFDSNPVAMWVVDRATLRFLSVNKAAAQQYGFSEQEFLAKTAVELGLEQDDSGLPEAIPGADSPIQPSGIYRHRRKNGSFIDVEIVCHPLEFGGVPSLLVSAYNITEQRRAEEAVRHAEDKYRGIFENSVIGIFQSTPEGTLLNINRALAEMHGYDSPEQLLVETGRAGSRLLATPSAMVELFQSAEDGVVRGAELEILRRDSTTKWVRMNLRAIRNSGGEIYLREGTVEDITEQKAAEARMKFLAYYDALTELPHRTLLEDRLETALASARRRKEKVALLFLDLDRFKIINDTFGHSFGDCVLQEVARRLRSCTREHNTVARVGGDEFLVLISDAREASDAAVAAERIMQTMKDDFIIQGKPFSMGCSLGVSIFPEHGTDAEVLIKNADAAMYAAKDGGRSSVRFFTEEMNAEAVARIAMDKNLRLALERDEFSLVYQPQLEIESGRVIGLEALIRWQQPEMGLVPPDKFIPIAENNGLILPIGEWVLRTACAQARRWQDEGLPRIPVAVNVSAVQFRQESFRALLRTVLWETGLSPEFLELELTESLLLSNGDATLSVLQEIKEMGLKLAIDDFGIGYSSFTYLKHFSVDRLKVDRSFVRDVIVDPDDAAITAAIISMAKSLHLRVIAEGVETADQLAFLRRNGCDEIQGYYFSHPLCVADVALLLRREQDKRNRKMRRAAAQNARMRVA